MEKEYAYSSDGMYYHGKFKTKKEALEEAKGSLGDGSHFYIGIIKDVVVSNYFDIDTMIEGLEEMIDDNDEGNIDNETEIQIDNKEEMEKEIIAIINKQCKTLHYTIIESEKVVI